MNKNHYIKSVGLLVVLVIFMSLTGFTDKQDDNVLVRIGDKTISLNEFLRRAEYTIRPAYCKNNTNVDKKVILNSLIAEKLLAMEAGEDNSFITNEKVKTFLLGRKEQAMRLFLYNDDVKSKVVLDTNKIKKAFKYAGREYQIDYVSLGDSVIVSQLENELIKGKAPFEKTLTDNYGLKEIPNKKVKWDGAENQIILDTLFTKDHKKGDVIGPLKITDGFYMFVKIKGWTNTPAVTQTQIENRYNSVKNVYEVIECNRAYDAYIKNLMKGKNVIFNKKAFLPFTDIVGPVYMRNDKEEKREALKEGVWNDKEEMKYKDIEPKLDEIRSETLFTIDGVNWTVDDFLKKIKEHPLVFRVKKFPQSEFGFQLQMAIMDMIRDIYLTKEAYARGYDKLPDVVAENIMWKDNLNALYEKDKILKKFNADSLFNVDYLSVIEKTLNPVIDSLQKKYSNSIFLNTKMFNEIKLTRIDMAVNYANIPFSQVVPNFPLITTDNKLDYGKPLK